MEYEDLPGDWRTCPEFPSASELVADDTEPLPHNEVDSPPVSKDQALRTHYKLCRYEAVEPLRVAINEIRENATRYTYDERKAFLYKEVKPIGILLSKQGAFVRISFSLGCPPVNWQDSKQLTPGTLVALSSESDCFESQCLVATVATRSFNSNAVPNPEDSDAAYTLPLVELFFPDSDEIPFNHADTDKFIMVEATVGYFENARSTMMGLQQAASEKSPLDVYIMGMRMPSGQLANVEAGVNPAGNKVVVPEAAHNLDVTQKEAFDAMTTQEYSLVQGPPGTGKTYTSIMAIKSYVETLRKASQQSRPPPIVIAAQTNYALDQILELCINQEIGKIVRLGGQSRSPIVSEHSMFNLRSSSSFREDDINGQLAWAAACHSIQQSIDLYCREIVSADELRNFDFLTAEQCQSLKDGYAAAFAEADNDFLDDPNSLDHVKCILAWVSDLSRRDQSAGLETLLPGRLRDTFKHKDGDNVLFADIESEGETGPAKGPEGARFRHRGVYIPLALQDAIATPPNFQKLGTWRMKTQSLLERYSDLYAISQSDRVKVYCCLKMEMRESLMQIIQEQLEAHNEICRAMKITRLADNAKIIKSEDIQIVGCTTTGLAKYRRLIADLKPSIMLIEEASEVREAHLAAAMFSSLTQLALVGDHQQLVPPVDNPLLARSPYNLQVSMFERHLKRQIVPYTILQVQRRMVPQIRKVVDTFYNAIRDHPLVLDPNERPPVEGTHGPLWWFQHRYPHQFEVETKSLTNDFEARQIVKFIRHLIAHNVKPHQITVLAYYSAQVALISRIIYADSTLRETGHALSLRTVDGFQGEENDIILLSLVRSSTNPMDMIDMSFTANKNRAVVALSRARRGLYVFGNGRTLARSVESRLTWEKVILEFEGTIGEHMPVYDY